jgi:hypothetical protein
MMEIPDTRLSLIDRRIQDKKTRRANGNLAPLAGGAHISKRRRRMTQEERMKKIAKIIAKAWADEGFKKRLLSGQAQVFKEEGVEIPPGVEVRVVEDTATVYHLVLPMKPTSNELSEEQLDQVSGGAREGEHRPMPPDTVGGSLACGSASQASRATSGE